MSGSRCRHHMEAFWSASNKICGDVIEKHSQLFEMEVEVVSKVIKIIKVLDLHHSVSSYKSVRYNI